MASVSNTCSSFSFIKEHPVRSVGAIAIITALAITAILIATQPSVLNFFNSTQGYWTIVGIALFTVAAGVWILKPACQRKNEANDITPGDFALPPDSEMNASQFTIIPDEPENSFPDKFFHTQQLDKLPQSEVGDYSFEPIQNSFSYLYIQRAEGDPIKVIVRASSKGAGLYRLVYLDRTGVKDYSVPLTASQISTTLRSMESPPAGMRISSLTTVFPKRSGIIIFTQDAPKKEYFFINTKGIFQSFDPSLLVAQMKRRS